MLALLAGFLSFMQNAVIAFGYILQAPEGLRLPSMIANVISVILTAIVTAAFLKKYKWYGKKGNKYY